MTTTYDRLVSWIRENGGYVDEDLYIEEVSPGNRCMKTRKEKALDQELVRIPKKLTLGGSDMTEVSVNMYKELEKSDSFLRPYLDSIPTTLDRFADHPLQKYNKDDAEDISLICPEAGSKMEHYLTLIRDVEGKVPPEHKDLATIATMLTITRSWGKGIGFIPFIDMMQHTYPKDNVCLLAEPDVCRLLSTGIKEGEELGYCYRSASHIDLYISYGIPPLDYNFMKAYIELSNPSETVKKTLEKFGFTLPILTLTFSDKDFVLNSLMVSRIINLEEGKTIVDSRPISLQNERDAIRRLLSILKEIKPDLTIKSEKYKDMVELNHISEKIRINTETLLRSLWLSYLR